MGRLVILFILVPLVELYLLAWLGAQFGFWNTVALVLLTGTLGIALSRWEGQRVWQAWQRSLAQGQMPEEGVLGGLLLLVGSVLLITPGVLTDVVGLLLLIPQSRHWLVRKGRPLVERHVEQGHRATTQGQARVSVVRMGSVSGFPFSGQGGVYRGPDLHRSGSVSPLQRPTRQRVLDAEFEVDEID